MIVDGSPAACFVVQGRFIRLLRFRQEKKEKKKETSIVTVDKAKPYESEELFCRSQFVYQLLVPVDVRAV